MYYVRLTNIAVKTETGEETIQDVVVASEDNLEKLGHVTFLQRLYVLLKRDLQVELLRFEVSGASVKDCPVILYDDPCLGASELIKALPDIVNSISGATLALAATAPALLRRWEGLKRLGSHNISAPDMLETVTEDAHKLLTLATRLVNRLQGIKRSTQGYRNNG